MLSLPVLGVTRDPYPASSEHSRRALADDLARVVKGEVRFGHHDRMLYATDASIYQVEPIGVVIPASIEDAVEAIRFCAKRGVPVLPRGGGTSLAGQCTNLAVVIDFSAHCRRLLGVDLEAGECRVEPGITIDDLNDALGATPWFFAPDPATSRQANIGGCIGNNAAGARSIKYGRTSENVLGLDACLSGGEVMRFERGSPGRHRPTLELASRVAELVRSHAALIRGRFPRTPRRNAGYNLDLVLDQLERGVSPGELDLSGLLCGSEGTLAVTLGARLRLRRRPVAKGLAVLAFSTLDEAIEAVGPILRTAPTAIELLDDTVLDLARSNSQCCQYLQVVPSTSGGTLRAVLYVEYFAQDDAKEIEEKFFPALRHALPGAPMALYTDAASMLDAWRLRKAGEPLLHGIAGHRKPLTFVEDNAVPVEHLARFVREFRRIVENHGTRAAFYAHASVGVLHVRPLLDIHEPEDRVKMIAIAQEAADLAASLGGVMSGEHGDGRVRTPLLERFYGPELMEVFRQVKGLFDPRNLLNPGNIVEPRPLASIAQSLRVQPADKPVVFPEVSTFFAYRDQHGLAAAAEMCNGAGVCRKKAGGTMCPSYMATLDERHSTRGRGNALRLAISGQLEQRWNDPETLATLDLCLSCKGCKAECPSNVDIARLKAEYLAQGYAQAGGAPWTSRLMGHVRTLNRLGSITPRLSNAVSNSRLGRTVIDRAFGFSPARSLPRFAPSLARAFPRSPAGSGEPTVVIFGDCFTMYNEPRVGLAARSVMEKLGYRVELLDAGCCGRAMISTGLLADAVSTIESTLERLTPILDRPEVRGVLVCEPSCLSAIRDDWLDLKINVPLATRERLASRSFLPEDFLHQAWDAHPRRPAWRKSDTASPVLLHGHCHQKALLDPSSGAAALRRCDADRLRVLDSGCCGMAGSFGYTAEHYDVSMKIGELSLFPAVRAASGATVLATGTSCRHQLKDALGVRALHPIEHLDQRLG